MSNLRLRVISGVALAIIVLALTFSGGIAFRVLAVVIAFAVLHEWNTMAGTGRSRGVLVALNLLLAVPMGMMLAGAAGSFALLLAGAAVLVALALDAALGRGWWRAAGIAYAAFPALALAALRGQGNAGLWLILFLFAGVWATDIFAYFIGRALRGPKLAPSISPGKTWSGAIGGALCAVLGGVGVILASGSRVQAEVLVLILILSAVSQIGDLFESWVKRRHGAKDSSNLIPGHGGVMDRVDGLVAAAVALYVVTWLWGGDPAAVVFPR